MTEKCQVGDVVRLKSGGPKMTVTKIEEERVHCDWFEKGKLHERIFRVEALEEDSNLARIPILVNYGTWRDG